MCAEGIADCKRVKGEKEKEADIEEEQKEEEGGERKRKNDYRKKNAFEVSKERRKREKRCKIL